MPVESNALWFVTVKQEPHTLNFSYEIELDPHVRGMIGLDNLAILARSV